MTLNIRRNVHLAALLGAFTATAMYGQQPQQQQLLQPGEPVGVPRPAAPNSVPTAKARQSPAARYSPLAAQGGYRGQRMTWYDALFHSLNPRNIDWGRRWEERRAAFLESTVANKYFVFCAFLVLCFYAALLAVGWLAWDHKKDIRYFKTELVKARNWATYWKGRAVEAITKHNAHIEKCNRVIEAGESGLSAGDTAEAGALRQQVEGMRIEVLNLTSENKRLRHDLEQKSTVVADLSVRVDDATKKIGSGHGPGNGAKGGENSVQVATLVDRINRLEETLRTVRLENERLKGA